MKYTCRYISAEFPAVIRENVPDFNGLLVYCLIFCKKNSCHWQQNKSLILYCACM